MDADNSLPASQLRAPSSRRTSPRFAAPATSAAPASTTAAAPTAAPPSAPPSATNGDTNQTVATAPVTTQALTNITAATPSAAAAGTAPAVRTDAPPRDVESPRDDDEEGREEEEEDHHRLGLRQTTPAHGTSRSPQRSLSSAGVSAAPPVLGPKASLSTASAAAAPAAPTTTSAAPRPVPLPVLGTAALRGLSGDGASATHVMAPSRRRPTEMTSSDGESSGSEILSHDAALIHQGIIHSLMGKGVYIHDSFYYPDSFSAIKMAKMMNIADVNDVIHAFNLVYKDNESNPSAKVQHTATGSRLKADNLQAAKIIAKQLYETVETVRCRLMYMRKIGSATSSRSSHRSSLLTIHGAKTQATPSLTGPFALEPRGSATNVTLGSSSPQFGTTRAATTIRAPRDGGGLSHRHTPQDFSAYREVSPSDFTPTGSVRSASRPAFSQLLSHNEHDDRAPVSTTIRNPAVLLPAASRSGRTHISPPSPRPAGRYRDEGPAQFYLDSHVHQAAFNDSGVPPLDISSSVPMASTSTPRSAPTLTTGTGPASNVQFPVTATIEQPAINAYSTAPRAFIGGQHFVENTHLRDHDHYYDDNVGRDAASAPLTAPAAASSSTNRRSTIGQAADTDFRTGRLASTSPAPGAFSTQGAVESNANFAYSTAPLHHGGRAFSSVPTVPPNHSGPLGMTQSGHEVSAPTLAASPLPQGVPSDPESRRLLELVVLTSQKGNCPALVDKYLAVVGLKGASFSLAVDHRQLKTIQDVVQYIDRRAPKALSMRAPTIETVRARKLSPPFFLMAALDIIKHVPGQLGLSPSMWLDVVGHLIAPEDRDQGQFLQSDRSNSLIDLVAKLTTKFYNIHHGHGRALGILDAAFKASPLDDETVLVFLRHIEELVAQAGELTLSDKERAARIVSTLYRRYFRYDSDASHAISQALHAYIDAPNPSPLPGPIGLTSSISDFIQFFESQDSNPPKYSATRKYRTEQVAVSMFTSNALDMIARDGPGAARNMLLPREQQPSGAAAAPSRSDRRPSGGSASGSGQASQPPRGADRDNNRFARGGQWRGQQDRGDGYQQRRGQQDRSDDYQQRDGRRGSGQGNVRFGDQQRQRSNSRDSGDDRWGPKRPEGFTGRGGRRAQRSNQRARQHQADMARRNSADYQGPSSTSAPPPSAPPRSPTPPAPRRPPAAPAPTNNPPAAKSVHTASLTEGASFPQSLRSVIQDIPDANVSVVALPPYLTDNTVVFRRGHLLGSSRQRSKSEGPDLSDPPRDGFLYQDFKTFVHVPLSPSASPRPRRSDGQPLTAPSPHFNVATVCIDVMSPSPRVATPIRKMTRSVPFQSPFQASAAFNSKTVPPSLGKSSSHVSLFPAASSRTTISEGWTLQARPLSLPPPSAAKASSPSAPRRTSTLSAPAAPSVPLVPVAPLDYPRTTFKFPVLEPTMCGSSLDALERLYIQQNNGRQLSEFQHGAVFEHAERLRVGGRRFRCAVASMNLAVFKAVSHGINIETVLSCPPWLHPLHWVNQCMDVPANKVDIFAPHLRAIANTVHQEDFDVDAWLRACGTSLLFTGTSRLTGRLCGRVYSPVFVNRGFEYWNGAVDIQLYYPLELTPLFRKQFPLVETRREHDEVMAAMREAAAHALVVGVPLQVVMLCPDDMRPWDWVEQCASNGVVDFPASWSMGRFKQELVTCQRVRRTVTRPVRPALPPRRLPQNRPVDAAPTGRAFPSSILAVERSLRLAAFAKLYGGLEQVFRSPPHLHPYDHLQDLLMGDFQAFHTPEALEALEVMRRMQNDPAAYNNWLYGLPEDVKIRVRQEMQPWMQQIHSCPRVRHPVFARSEYTLHPLTLAVLNQNDFAAVRDEQELRANVQEMYGILRFARGLRVPLSRVLRCPRTFHPNNWVKQLEANGVVREVAAHGLDPELSAVANVRMMDHAPLDHRRPDHYPLFDWDAWLDVTGLDVEAIDLYANMPRVFHSYTHRVAPEEEDDDWVPGFDDGDFEGSDGDESTHPPDSTGRSSVSSVGTAAEVLADLVADQPPTTTTTTTANNVSDRRHVLRRRANHRRMLMCGLHNCGTVRFRAQRRAARLARLTKQRHGHRRPVPPPSAQGRAGISGGGPEPQRPLLDTRRLQANWNRTTAPSSSSFLIDLNGSAAQGVYALQTKVKGVPIVVLGQSAAQCQEAVQMIEKLQPSASLAVATITRPTSPTTSPAAQAGDRLMAARYHPYRGQGATTGAQQQGVSRADKPQWWFGRASRMLGPSFRFPTDRTSTPAANFNGDTTTSSWLGRRVSLRPRPFYREAPETNALQERQSPQSTAAKPAQRSEFTATDQYEYRPHTGPHYRRDVSPAGHVSFHSPTSAAYRPYVLQDDRGQRRDTSPSPPSPIRFQPPTLTATPPRPFAALLAARPSSPAATLEAQSMQVDVVQLNPDTLPRSPSPKPAGDLIVRRVRLATYKPHQLLKDIDGLSDISDESMGDGASSYRSNPRGFWYDSNPSLGRTLSLPDSSGDGDSNPCYFDTDDDDEPVPYEWTRNGNKYYTAEEWKEIVHEHRELQARGRSRRDIGRVRAALWEELTAQIGQPTSPEVEPLGLESPPSPLAAPPPSVAFTPMLPANNPSVEPFRVAMVYVDDLINVEFVPAARAPPPSPATSTVPSLVSPSLASSSPQLSATSTRTPSSSPAFSAPSAGPSPANHTVTSLNVAMINVDEQIEYEYVPAVDEQLTDQLAVHAVHQYVNSPVSSHSAPPASPTVVRSEQYSPQEYKLFKETAANENLGTDLTELLTQNTPLPRPRRLFTCASVKEQLVDPSVTDEINAHWDRGQPDNFPSDAPVPVEVNRELLTKEQQDKVTALLVKYRDAFANNAAELKHSTAGYLVIDVGNVTEIKSRRFRLSQADREYIDKKVLELYEKGHIEPFQSSSFVSELFVVPKKDEHGRLVGKRLVQDFVALNKVTVKNHHPIPVADTILTSLGEAKCYSSLDMQDGFHQLTVDPASRDYTAFFAAHRLWRWISMPQGCSTAPACFQRTMLKVLGGYVGKFCWVYLDDVLIFSPDVETHIHHLGLVLQRLVEHDLRCKPPKCHLFCESVKFLGHVVTKNGVLPDSDKIAAITKLTPPTNVRDVRSVLGLVGYYRRFIAKFAVRARPLIDLTCADVPFNWTEECQKAFDDLRTCLVTAPILVQPDFSLPFTIETDACKHGFGAVLSQKSAAIAYASRALRSSELKMSASEGECMAVVWAITKFHPYIHEHSFEVLTDADCLRWLLNHKHSNGKLNRWALLLQSYLPYMTISHRAGVSNKAADALSRTTHMCVVCESEPQLAVRLTVETPSGGVQRYRPRLCSASLPLAALEWEASFLSQQPRGTFELFVSGRPGVQPPESSVPVGELVGSPADAPMKDPPQLAVVARPARPVLALTNSAVAPTQQSPPSSPTLQAPPEPTAVVATSAPAASLRVVASSDRHSARVEIDCDPTTTFLPSVLSEYMHAAGERLPRVLPRCVVSRTTQAVSYSQPLAVLDLQDGDELFFTFPTDVANVSVAMPLPSMSICATNGNSVPQKMSPSKRRRERRKRLEQAIKSGLRPAPPRPNPRSSGRPTEKPSPSSGTPPPTSAHAAGETREVGESSFGHPLTTQADETCEAGATRQVFAESGFRLCDEGEVEQEEEQADLGATTHQQRTFSVLPIRTQDFNEQRDLHAAAATTSASHLDSTFVPITVRQLFAILGKKTKNLSLSEERRLQASVPSVLQKLNDEFPSVVTPTPATGETKVVSSGDSPSVSAALVSKQTYTMVTLGATEYPVSIMLDTGAECSLLPQAIAEQLSQLDPTLAFEEPRVRKTVTGVNGLPASVIVGVFPRLSYTIAGVCEETGKPVTATYVGRFYVLSDVQYIILGVPEMNDRMTPDLAPVKGQPHVRFLHPTNKYSDGSAVVGRAHLERLYSPGVLQSRRVACVGSDGVAESDGGPSAFSGGGTNGGDQQRPPAVQQQPQNPQNTQPPQENREPAVQQQPAQVQQPAAQCSHQTAPLHPMQFTLPSPMAGYLPVRPGSPSFLPPRPTTPGFPWTSGGAGPMQLSSPSPVRPPSPLDWSGIMQVDFGLASAGSSSVVRQRAVSAASNFSSPMRPPSRAFYAQRPPALQDRPPLYYECPLTVTSIEWTHWLNSAPQDNPNDPEALLQWEAARPDTLADRGVTPFDYYQDRLQHAQHTGRDLNELMREATLAVNLPRNWRLELHGRGQFATPPVTLPTRPPTPFAPVRSQAGPGRFQLETPPPGPPAPHVPQWPQGVTQSSSSLQSPVQHRASSSSATGIVTASSSGAQLPPNSQFQPGQDLDQGDPHPLGPSDHFPPPDADPLAAFEQMREALKYNLQQIRRSSNPSARDKERALRIFAALRTTSPSRSPHRYSAGPRNSRSPASRSPQGSPPRSPPPSPPRSPPTVDCDDQGTVRRQGRRQSVWVTKRTQRGAQRAAQHQQALAGGGEDNATEKDMWFNPELIEFCKVIARANATGDWHEYNAIPYSQRNKMRCLIKSKRHGLPSRPARPTFPGQGGMVEDFKPDAIGRYHLIVLQWDEDREVLERLDTDLQWKEVPEPSQRAALMDCAHSEQHGMGWQEAFLRQYWWPGIRTMVRQLHRKCAICQGTTSIPATQQPLRPLPVVPMFSRVSLDLMVGLTMSPEGYTNCLTVVDSFSKQVEFVPLRTQSAREVAMAFFTQWVARYGPPLTVLLDNGGCWEGDFNTLCREMGIEVMHSAAYNPQANGLVEVTQRYAKVGIARLLLQFALDTCQQQDGLQQYWPYFLAQYAMHYRFKRHTATGQSPYQLLFNLDPYRFADRLRHPNIMANYQRASPLEVRASADDSDGPDCRFEWRHGLNSEQRAELLQQLIDNADGDCVFEVSALSQLAQAGTFRQASSAPPPDPSPFAYSIASEASRPVSPVVPAVTASAVTEENASPTQQPPGPEPSAVSSGTPPRRVTADLFTGVTVTVTPPGAPFIPGPVVRAVLPPSPRRPLASAAPSGRGGSTAPTAGQPRLVDLRVTSPRGAPSVLNQPGDKISPSGRQQKRPFEAPPRVLPPASAGPAGPEFGLTQREAEAHLLRDHVTTLLHGRRDRSIRRYEAAMSSPANGERIPYGPNDLITIDTDAYSKKACNPLLLRQGPFRVVNASTTAATYYDHHTKQVKTVHLRHTARAEVRLASQVSMCPPELPTNVLRAVRVAHEQKNMHSSRDLTRPVDVKHLVGSLGSPASSSMSSEAPAGLVAFGRHGVPAFPAWLAGMAMSSSSSASGSVGAAAPPVTTLQPSALGVNPQEHPLIIDVDTPMPAAESSLAKAPPKRQRRQPSPRPQGPRLQPPTGLPAAFSAPPTPPSVNPVPMDVSDSATGDGATRTYHMVTITGTVDARQQSVQQELSRRAAEACARLMARTQLDQHPMTD